MSSDEPIVNATRFRRAHLADWQMLETLIGKLEKRSPRALTDDELVALPRLYRSTAISLSVARNTSLDRSMIDYLEHLTTRAYFQIYGVKNAPLRQLAEFFSAELPRAVRALWRETLFCVVLTVAAALLAFILIGADPTWYYSIIPDGLAQGRDPGSSAEALRETLYDDSNQSILSLFATFLFTHNAQIAIFAFALGFAFGLPTILLILYNGLMLGAFFAVFASRGLALDLAAWLAIHGTTEIFAICLSGACGLRIGTAVAFPGRWSRADSAIRAGRTSAVVMLGVIMMLAVAGILEGVGRQVIHSIAARTAIGVGALVMWLSYFYLVDRRTRNDG